MATPQKRKDGTDFAYIELRIYWKNMFGPLNFNISGVSCISFVLILTFIHYKKISQCSQHCELEPLNVIHIYVDSIAKIIHLEPESQNKAGMNKGWFTVHVHV
jgi:hypothetical protein